MTDTQNNTESAKPAKKRRKWPWITLAVFILLIAFVRWSLQADWVFNIIKTQAEEIVSETTGAEFTIGGMSGDLLRGISIHDVKLKSDDPIITLDSLFVNYRFSALFSRTIDVTELRISGLYASLEQLPDSSWNMMQLIPEPTEPDEEPGDFPFTIELRSLQLVNSSIDVYAPYLLPDDRIEIRNLEVSASATYSTDVLDATLDSFALDLIEGRLPEGIRLETSGAMAGERITLDRLMISTGRSLLEAEALYELDGSEIDATVDMPEINRSDLAAYIEDLPDFEIASLRLKANGSLREIEAGLTLHSPGLLRLDMNATIDIEPEIVLTSLHMELDELDLRRLTNDPELDAEAGRITLSVDGHIPAERYEEARASIKLELSRARFEEIVLTGLTLESTLDNGSLIAETRLSFPDQRIDLRADLNRIWSDYPEWDIHGDLLNINPGYFAQDTTLSGNVTGSIAANGRGFEPDDEPWGYRINLQNLVMMEFDQLGNITLEGTLDATTLVAALEMDSPGGSIVADGRVSQWQEEVPRWYLALETSELDIAVLANMEDFPTNINAKAELEGEGTGGDDLKLTLTTTLENSRVLNEPFDQLDAQIVIEENILYIRETRIDSRFISGFLEGRLNLDDYTDRQNVLDFDFEISNLETFAELAGADTLHGNGRLWGQLRPQDDGTPLFETELDFSDIIFNDITVENVTGSIAAALRDEPEIDVDIKLNRPMMGEIVLQDIRFINSTTIAEEAITGDLDIRLLRTSSYGLFHEGSFRIAEQIELQTTRLDLVEDGFSLNLESAFGVYISGDGEEQTVRMDTLSMASDIGGRLQLWAETGPGDFLQAWVKADRLDMGTCQDALLDERIADLFFTGEIQLRMEGDDLEASIDTELTDINYEGLTFDRYLLQVDISDNRMEIVSNLTFEERELMDAAFSLPFRLGDPENFPESFYEEQVEGYLTLNPLDLEVYDDFLEQAGLGALKGTIQFNSELSGVAGNPQLSGRFQLAEATVSGVSVEDFFFEFNYLNELSELELNSEVRSMGQIAAQFEGTLPLFIDMRTLTIEEPSESDGINIRAETNDFNISAFTDFLDRDVARNLRGRLNANLEITGTVGNPEPVGSIRLESGRIQLVENNINITNINADIGFDQNEININSISAESSGSFNMSGNIMLADFRPGEFDINARMRNFRVYNTRDLDAYVTLDTSLDGTIESPRLSGEVRVERGYIFLDNFGERQVEQVRLEDEDDEFETFFEDFFEALAIELNLIVSRRYFIRNRSNPELDLELEGNIDVVKSSGGEIELFGDVTTVRGNATTLGRQFELDEGIIIFSGPADNPEFDIQLSYRVRREDDIRIMYRISGTAEEPEFTFDSEPQMELQDIISYTLFGRPFHALQGWEQGVSGNASAGDVVADAALELLLDRLQNIAADRLGVDVIEIDTASQTDGGTRIKAGKFLSDRLFVALVQELGSDPNSQVIIEYLLRRNLELIFTGSDDYRSGLDILWRLDY